MSDQAAAMFVFGAAEYIRCADDSQGWRWEPICRNFGLVYTNQCHVPLSDAVRRGLEWWRRTLFQGEYRTAYLKSLVFESGIPAAAVGPWLQRWVTETTRSVRAGIAAGDAARQFEFIAPIAGGDLLTPAVAALALGIARIAETVPPAADRLGIEVVTWLHAKRPGWQQDVGLRLPETELNQVIRAVFAELPADSGRISVSRVLIRGADGWASAVRFILSGKVPTSWPIGPLLSGRSRARLLPAGALLERAQMPLAVLLLEIDDAGRGSWQLQQTGPSALVLASTEAAQVVVSTDGDTSDPITLAHPLDVDAPVVVFTRDIGHPDQLIFRAAGSCRLGESEAILAVSSAIAEVMRSVEGAVPMSDGRFEGYSLWQIDRPVVLPGGIVIRLGEAAAPTPLLHPVGPTLPRVEGYVFRRIDTVIAEDVGGRRVVPPEKLRWRPVGTRRWHSWARGPFGDVVIGQAESDDIVAGDVRVHVAPEGLEISQAGETLRLRVPEGVLVSCPSPGSEVKCEPENGTLQIIFPPIQMRSLPITLHFGNGSSMTLDVADPRVDQAFTDSAGRIERSARSLALPSVHGWTAEARSGGTLTLSLMLRNSNPGKPALVRVTGSRPLLSLMPTARTLIGSAGDLDAKVRTEWLGPFGGRLDLGLYDLRLEARGGGVHLPGACAGTLYVAAMPLLDPVRVEVLYRGEAERRPEIMCPTGDVGGAWLAWATLNGAARVRPRIFLRGEPAPEMLADREAHAIAVADANERQTRIISCLTDPTTRRRMVSRIRAMLASVAGSAPPCALDPARALAQVPDAAVFLLASADTPEEIGTILLLDEELPLVWGATPLQVWQDAFGERVAALVEKLTAAELPRDLADGAIRSLLKCVPLLRPALVMHAAFASSDPAAVCDALKTSPSTADALRAALVELDEAANFPCPVPVSDLAVPLDSCWHGAATAPSVAAQIALSKVLPAPELLRWLWTVQMTIPRWFERACLYELYPHFLALAKEPAR